MRFRFSAMFRSCGGYAILVAALLLLAGAAHWRDEVVTGIPDLAGLYAALGLDTNRRGMRFETITLSPGESGLERELVVAGQLRNVTAGHMAVPAIRLSLVDAADREIYVWTILPEREELAGGMDANFRSKFATPPGNAKNVRLRLADR